MGGMPERTSGDRLEWSPLSEEAEGKKGGWLVATLLLACASSMGRGQADNAELGGQVGDGLEGVGPKR